MAALCLFSIAVGGMARAASGADRPQGLSFRGKNSSIPAPVLGSTVELKVTGIIARAKVTQIFKNVSDEWVEGIYIFPLPGDAAVDSLRMKIGNRTILGVVQEKDEARQIYEAAKQNGVKASLFEQQLPDVFSTAVANVGPGETVEVSIELQQVVKWEQGHFSLRFPMVVAQHPNATKESGPLVLPQQLPPGAPSINPFAFHADLYPGLPLAKLESPSHAIAVAQGKGFHYAVDLAKGVEPADSDLILEWTPAVGREPRAVYYSEEVGGERYSLLMVMPPDSSDAVASRLPRETIFIIDNSGSMAGAKLEQARRALLLGLSRLQPMDSFNVIRFSSTAGSVFPQSVPASSGAVEQARRWIDDLEIEGGTNMLPAMEIAFRNPPPTGLVPQVIFATDGQLEDEPQVVKFLHANLGERRLFPIAIGPDPNAHLLGQLATMGRGSFTAITDIGKVATAMDALFSKLESPMLQGIDVQWSDPAAEAWPARAPDLYLGEPLIVTARSGGSAGPVTVSGLRSGSAWTDSFPAAADVKGAGIDKLWARRKIGALTDSLLEGADRAEVRRAVAELGLRHHLVTDYTSLVAVDETPTAPAGIELVSTVVPVNRPRQQSYVVRASSDMVLDCISVTTESPLLDERRLSMGATVSQTELAMIPTSRDPWAALQSAPGVLTDRINVGGNESGQQSRYVGPGSAGDQAVWSVDGVVITDMTALGSSPGYYDFDAFEEMNVTTGGSDATLATGGVMVNLVTKRGTNEWRGTARYLKSDSGLQAAAQGNRIDKTTDQGAEAGGPLVKDRIWAWGSGSRSQIDLLTIDNFRDNTTLDDWNVKLNAQLSENNSADGLAWLSDKIKQGRNAGPLRPQETTWDQSRTGPGPTAWKAEDTDIFNSAWYMTGLISQVRGGFQLLPEGGDRLAHRGADLVWHDSFLRQEIERPQKQGKLDGSIFVNNDATSHELKYGAGYRTAESSTLIDWPGGGFDLDLGGSQLRVLSRDAAPKVKTEYESLYLQDTLAVGRLTANAGVRWDHQGGRNEASVVAANPAFPNLLPAVRYAGQDAGFTWSDIAPRLGLTWALDQDRRTLLRASYSRFADQLGTLQAGWLNPLGGLGYRYFVGPQEIAPPSGNVNPVTFGFLQSNAVDANLSAPLTDEALLSLEHALLPEFLVGFNLSYRKLHNLLEAERLVFDAADPFAAGLLDSTGRVHRRGDYVERSQQVVAPDGSTYTVPYWELRSGVSTRNGFYLTNGEREQESKGASLTLNKRLSNRWMMRGNVSYQDWKWQIPGSANEDPTDTLGGGVVNGTEVLQGSGTASGPKGNVFINARWSYNLNGLYQVSPDRPWGFNVAANLTGRQGYPLRYASRINRTTISDNGGSGLDVPIQSDPSAFRYPDVHVVDLRLEKEFVFSDFGLTFGLDVFNALNASYVLQRQGVLAQNGVPVDNAGSVLETLSPRIFRLGARLSFR
jgi:Ca-activated chloride channel family protein